MMYPKVRLMLAAGLTLVLAAGSVTAMAAAAKEKGEQTAKAKAEKKAPAAKPKKSPAKPMARQGTPVLGVVIGKPPGAEGAEVVRVWPGSPAAKAGIESGDRIVQLDGKPVKSPEALREAVLKHKPGQQVALTVRRGGEEKQFKVQLARADDFTAWARRGEPEEFLRPRAWLGVRIAPESGRGVKVAAVFPNSPADAAGLRTGDDIIRVDKARVEAPADLQGAIAKYKPGQTVNLVFERGGESKEVKVELGSFEAWRGDVSELTEPEVRQMLERLMEGLPPFREGELQPPEKPAPPKKQSPKPEKTGRRQQIEKRIAELEKELQRLKRQLSEQ